MTENRDTGRLAEDAAHRVLARAVELDSTRATELTVAQLRESALEAGISASAFEAALREWSEGRRLVATRAPSTGSNASPIARWLVARRTDVVMALTGAPVRNIAALAVFWGVLVMIVSFDRANGVHWLIRKASDPLALGIGAAIAMRLRARPVSLLLAGLAIAQGSEFLMDAYFRVPAVQGFGSHLALMIAGVAGVLLGARTFGRPPSHNAIESRVAVEAEAEPSPEIRNRVRSLDLRLGVS